VVTERDEGFEAWPAEAVGDPVREAIGQLLVAIIESTAEGSPERAKAMTEALEAYGRIKAAMSDRPRLN
jgi:hypothetical protein